MTHNTLRSVAVLVLSMASTSAHAWTPNGVVWPPERRPVQIGLHNTPVDDLTAADMEQIVQQSFARWNEIPCADIQIAYDGLTEESLNPDDRQILHWIDDEETWSGFGSMTAGATIINAFRNPETGEFDVLQIDIAFNNIEFEWVVGGGGIRSLDKLDPENVVTHEIGHLLGLGHTQDDAAATMSPAYRPDLSQQTLAFDDKTGLCEIYWKAGPDECQQDADCLEGQMCRTHTHEATGESIRLCAELRGDFGAPCSRDDLNCDPCQGERGCRPLCLFTKTDLSEGFCSTLCEEDTDCPPCWTCYNIQSVNNPFYTCRPVPEEEMCDPNAEPDAGLDTQEDPEEDAQEDPQEDLPELDAEEPAPEDEPDPEPADTHEDTTSPPPTTDDCACHSVASPKPIAPSALLLAPLAAMLLRRRRSTHAKAHHPAKVTLLLLAMLGVMTSPQAHAQENDEMNFEAAEVKIRTYVATVEVGKKIKKKEKENLVAAIEQAVYGLEDAELISPEMANLALGKQGKNLLKCKDIACILPFTTDAQLDRVLLSRIDRSADGVLVIDLELYDGLSGERLAYDAATGESADDTSFVMEVVSRMLAPPKPTTAIPIKRTPLQEEPPSETPEPDSGGPWITRDLANYTLLGGISVVALGGLFGLLADNTQAAIQAAPHDKATLDQLVSSGETYQLTANALLGLGLLGLATGGVFYFLTDDPQDTTRPSAPGAHNDLRLRIGPASVSIELKY